jgi:hypothetical protein
LTSPYSRRSITEEHTVSRPEPEAGQFDIESQRADSISNIGRDQVIYQGQQPVDLGRPRRGGPWTMGVGGLLFLAGSGVWGFAVLSSVFQIFNFVGEGISSNSAQPPSISGFDFHTGLLAVGAAIVFSGIVVFFIGLFLTIVTWRRRRPAR